MSEKKDKVGGLKNNAVKKEDLPVVTQLFTPKWIVQYMVQNSLGKLYDEKYEDNNLSKHWEYYLKHEENHHLYPEFDSLEELKIMDPACGSGHILLYAFDMLYDMYQEAGYPSRDIPQLILENNLYGLDIDKRSQQIANFALMMKAVEKQPRLLSKLHRKKEEIKINVYEIVDTDKSLSEEAINYFVKDNLEKKQVKNMMSQFDHGKQFGSLIKPIGLPYRKMIEEIINIENQSQDLIDESYIKELKEKLLPIVRQANLLYEKYDVVVTNPPYHNKYNPLLRKFMNDNYREYKSDLYSAFVYSNNRKIKENGYSSLMTPYTWMFISSHEKLRNYIMNDSTISSLVQLEYSSFEEATVPICSFVIHNQTAHTNGEYVRLSNFKGSQLQPEKLKYAANQIDISYKFISDSKSFDKIPGSPIAYWAPEKVKDIFSTSETIEEIAKPRQGMATSDNNRFLRQWYEVDIKKVGFGFENETEAEKSGAKWFPYNKGGSYKKWYGNYEKVVNWENNGENIKEFEKSVVRNSSFYFKEGITWSFVSSSYFGVRFAPKGFLFDVGGSSLFPDKNIRFYLGYLASKVTAYFMSFLNPTLNFQVGNVGNLPLPIFNEESKSYIEEVVDENINIAKFNWDTYETSWDFDSHPLNKVDNEILISNVFIKWVEKSKTNFNKMRTNEEKINKIFIDNFQLQKYISEKVSDEEITMTLPDRFQETKSYLSYFIGCLTGRYSLDIKGLAYAGGKFDDEKYTTFKPNKDGLIQITEDQYFENDIIIRLKEFLAITFSKVTVDENIKWLAESLTMRKNESSEERLRRYFMDEFFKDHCKTYQKRPIYWLVDSGKQKGLRTLIYMHRYQSDTMATIRFEHLQEIQSKYQNEIEMLEIRLSNPDISASDRRNLEKSKESYQKKIEELQEFDKKLAVYANEPIDIDLDDGVKVNYAKFNYVLAKIK